MPRFRNMTVLSVTVLLLVACDAPADRGPEEMSRQQLEALEDRHAFLDGEPGPPPRPSADADPSDVPEPVEEALPEDVLETVTGEATFYADVFEGRRTASGIPLRQNEYVAAHPAYPFGSLLRVTNLRNEKSVKVRVVDRGPFGARAKARGTILDLSRRAAGDLDFVRAGRTPIRVEVLEWGEGIPRSG